MDFGPGQIGKILIFLGLIIVAVGLLFLMLGKFGILRLPGDFEFGGRNWRIYFPLASCVIISIILTLVLWLLRYFRR